MVLRAAALAKALMGVTPHTFLQHRSPQCTEVLLQRRQRLLLHAAMHSSSSMWTLKWLASANFMKVGHFHHSYVDLWCHTSLAKSAYTKLTSSSPTYSGRSSPQLAGEWKPANTSVASLPAYV